MEIEATTDIFKLDEGQRDLYATLGRFQYFMTSYEFDCDEFVFEVAALKPDFITAKKLKPPYNKHDQTIEFIDECIRSLPELYELRDIRLGTEGHSLKEYMRWIWHHRNNLSHGKMLMGRSGIELKEFKLTRWIRDDQKNSFARVQYSYDSALLKSTADAAQRVRVLLQSASRALSGENARDDT